MSATTRASVICASLSLLLGSGQLTAAGALADEQPQQQLHNVTYRATIDGVSRGTIITFNSTDTEVQTANPTMLPGQPFEANAVLADPKNAGMEVSIRWPYTAKLRCEIVVDDTVTAQADQFVAPRLLPASSDPGYGALACGGPLANAAATAAGAAAVGNGDNAAPVSPSAAAQPPGEAPPET